MPQLKLFGVEPARIRAEPVRWEQRRGRDHHRPGGRSTTARARLLAALLPGQDPEACEIGVDVDARGETTGIVVRDLQTGNVLVRLDLDQLTRLGGNAGQGGLFIERRG